MAQLAPFLHLALPRQKGVEGGVPGGKSGIVWSWGRAATIRTHSTTTQRDPCRPSVPPISCVSLPNSLGD